MKKHDIIEIDCDIRVETEKAFGVYVGKTGEDGNDIIIWLPKSQVENNNDGTLSMPEWLAMEKELI